MPNKMAVIDYQICAPEKCENGVCMAVLACPKKILRQVERFEMPDPIPSLCLSCAKCVQACPMKAVLLV